jgi:hypothetical protein
MARAEMTHAYRVLVGYPGIGGKIILKGILVYGLFKDAVSRLHYAALNDRLIDE